MTDQSRIDDRALERSKLAAEIRLRRRELALEERRVEIEETRLRTATEVPWYKSSLPWLGPTLGALVAVLSIVLSSSLAQYASIKTERFQRESQIILQATNGVSQQEALANLKFYADIGYLTENVALIRDQIEKGIAPTTNKLPILRREISRIIIGADKSGIGNRNITNLEIREHYVKALGWADVGFHFIIKQSGEIVAFRDINETPAVALGNNFGTIGIGLQVFEEPKADGTSYSAEQKSALKKFLASMAKEYGVEKSAIHVVTEFRPMIDIGIDNALLSELTSEVVD